MKNTFICAVIIIVSSCSSLYSQSYQRISGNFSQKYKSADGKLNLIKGQFYYDIKFGKTVYDIQFPESQIWVFEDTVHYIFKGDTLFEAKLLSYSNQLSIFHLSLTQNLDNYGLKNSIFEIEKTEVADDQTITYWKPQHRFRKKMGRIVISKKEKSLFGVLFYDPEDILLRKQFYRNYQTVQGINFPGEVIDIFYRDGTELYQKTEYKKIVINEIGKDHRYRYKYIF